MALDGIDTWIFDLDNTLYSARARLFDQVCARIEAYVGNFLGVDADEARQAQVQYFHRHGTTLRGLMVEHGADPHHYLEFVHDIDLSPITIDAKLRSHLQALPGKRLIFTNADTPYARRVLDRLGIGDLFTAIQDVHASDYIPKPRPEPYARLIAEHGLTPAKSIFFEDMARNLAPAKALGMTTVWIDNQSDQGPTEGLTLDHIDHRSDCIVRWFDQSLASDGSQ
jgi:putative hydrolase of the HAD superfamily